MAKLNQIVAIEKSVKNQMNSIITEAHQTVMKPALLTGIARTYKPTNEDGDKLPSESTLVQIRAANVLAKVATAWTELLDVTMTKDAANCSARSDVVVDGVVVVPQVPVTSLLFLEKQLIDIHTVIKKLPTLDPSERWSRDEAQDCWSTSPAETKSTKKIPRNHVKAKATEHHPEQVELYMEDVLAGLWSTIKFSGAMQETRKTQLLERVEKLQRAVKFAREDANSIDAPPVKGGDKIFGYLLSA